MQYIAYIVTALSIIGTIANSLQKRWCFIVWGFTNTFWCIFNIITGSYAQAILYAFNFVMAIVGLIKWSQKEKSRSEKEKREFEIKLEQLLDSDHVVNDDYYIPSAYSGLGSERLKNVFTKPE